MLLWASQRRKIQEGIVDDLKKIHDTAFPSGATGNHHHHRSEANKISNIIELSLANLNERLLFACINGRRRDVEYLVHKGADCKYHWSFKGVWNSFQESSPIHHVLLRIVQRRPNPDPASRTELLEMLTILLEHGADVNALYSERFWTGSTSSRSALHIGVSIDPEEAGEQYTSHLLTLLLNKKYNANVNFLCGEQYHTMRYDGSGSVAPLHRAVAVNSVIAVKSESFSFRM